MHEVQRAIHSLRKHETPVYDGLHAEAYYHLPAHLLRILAHRLWDIVTGQTPLPPDWANVVRPLYKKGDWANPDKWRPIVCGVTEVKMVWTILLCRIRCHLDPHIPASLWGAIPGRSPHEAIFLQDTIADMDPVDLIIASLDVKGGGVTTPGPPLLQLWPQLQRHPQVHGPHGSRPHPLPGARQRGPPSRSRRPLPIPPRDAPPGPHNRAGLPGVRTLPPPSPPWWDSRTTPTSRSYTQHTNPAPQTPGQRSPSRPTTYWT